jgi:outer membrane protein
MRTVRAGRGARVALSALAAGALLALAAPALAQPAPGAAPPVAPAPGNVPPTGPAPGPAPVPVPTAAPGPAPRNAPAPTPGRAAPAGVTVPATPMGSGQAAPATAGQAATATPADIALPQQGPDALAAALAPQPGGLTPDETAKRAVGTKRSIRAKQAELRAAQARVDQALVGFFPRVSATAQYTRLSPTEAAIGPITIVGIQNQYSLGASLALPISDYVLRLSQAYASASHAESAKKIEVQAEVLTAASDAKIAFFNWARAKGQAVVATQAVTQAKGRVEDAKLAQAAGFTSRADVLRLEAQVAAAEQVQAEASAFEAIAGEQLRIVIRAPAGEPLTLGIDILSSAPTAAGPAEPVETLQRQALEKRLEIRALDETQYSLKSAVSLARAGYAPRIDAFANVQYANPNQRIFPQAEEWRATWDAGIRMTWTINDTFTALGAVAEAKARAEGVAEQKAALMEGLRLEVMSAYSDLQKARASIEAAARGLAAAEESLRVRRLLFKTGRATSLDLVDAETEATRAQLRRIDAHVGLLVAQTRLAHATGRDIKADQEGR